MVEIIPGVLATNESEYAELLTALNQAEILEGGWLQWDLMDGVFVDNKSVDLELMDKYPTDFQIEAQLMVSDPEAWFEKLIAMDVKRIIFPIEISTDINSLIQKLKETDIEVGISLNPETEVDKIAEYINEIDEVLVMSVHPGFGGQEFIDDSIKKVAQLRQMNQDVIIGVDGGISPDVAPKLVAAGANNLVIGSKRLIENGIDETLEKYWEILQEKS